jgi:Fe-S-cluster containining protein
MSAERAHLRINHPVVQLVDPDIFRFSFAPDCMSHACAVEPDAEDCDKPGVQLDACCRYGADVDLFERDRIRAKADLIAPLLRPELRDPARWFNEKEPEESESPSGWVVRTGKQDPSKEAGLCVFLGHDKRGCAIHRAAFEQGFPPESIKPAVCRLYPIAYGEGELGLADDFDWYSCGHHEGGPSVYRVMRDEIALQYGPDLIAELDAAENKVLRRRLRVTAA